MQKTDAALEVPGARRRVQRWRSWWNKQEMYPPSVDRWLGQRSSFYRAERAHTQNYACGIIRELQAGAAAAQGGTWNTVLGHVKRGSFLLWTKPIHWHHYSAE